MRVLQYNWVDPEDLAGRGGGVRVYMQGLVRAQAECAGMQVVTLASGLAHDLGARAPRWRCVRKGHFEIVNARPLAPSQADFASPAQISHSRWRSVQLVPGAWCTGLCIAQARDSRSRVTAISTMVMPISKAGPMRSA